MGISLEDKDRAESKSELTREGDCMRQYADGMKKNLLLSPVRTTKLLLFITFFLLVCHLVVCHLALVVLGKLEHSPGFPLYEKIYFTFYDQFHLALDGNFII